MRKLLAIAAGSAICFAASAQKGTAPASKMPSDSAKATAPKKASVGDKTKGNKKNEGFFTLYQDTATGSVQMYIKKDQLGKEFIYESFSINGPTTLFLNQSMHRDNAIFKIEKAFDKLEFSRVNTSAWYDPNNAVSKTANVDKPEAVFHTEKVVLEDSTGYLISIDGLFLSEKMDPVKPNFGPNPFAAMTFNLGSLNPMKSKYANIRSYPNNTDVVVDLNYDNPYAMASGGADVTDPRFVRVRMQHSFIAMPENGYKPRMDDPRIGYFMQEVDNRTSVSPTPYKDMINRWSLVKKDPSAALSEPVEPIIFWVENTTPVEYRQTVVDAGMKWNQAFEKAGFKNAVQMRIMPDTASWDPADVRYNVIRWVSSAQPSYGAIGPSFVNPRTGQILGADITVEWYSGSATPIMDELVSGPVFGAANAEAKEQNHVHEMMNAFGKNHMQTCAIASELKAQFLTGSTTLDAAGAAPEEIAEMHKQFLTYLIMHEMGHTLGLNHNMKASQMLSPAEVHNTAITRKIGLQGSVMDYPSINIALDRTKQGDYYTMLAGPYDLWAIEYGYKQFATEAEEKDGLKKILDRSTEPYLTFGNDGDDMRSPGKGMDPRVNVNDMSNDMVTYAEDRFKLVNNLMGKIVAKYSKPNQSYAELRTRYGVLNRQRADMASAVSRYIGGVYVDRSFPDQRSVNKPFTPVSMADQKKAMALLTKYVFAPTAFNADAQVFPYLQMQRRGYNQPAQGEDYKITNTILANQVNTTLAHILNPATLQRITNSRLYGNQYSAANVMNDLIAGIFNADLTTNVNVYRQYLQTAFVRGNIRLLGDMSGVDDVSKASVRYALTQLKTKLATAISTNEETKAHRANMLFMINDALNPKK